MSLPTQSSGSKTERTVPTLLFAASCVILMALAAGLILRGNIDRVIRARDWVEHSYDVQSTLQGIQLRLDRLDSVEHLYLFNRSPATLRDAQNLGIAIESNAHRLSGLVADNLTQSQNAQRLNQCAHEMIQAIRVLEAPDTSFPTTLQFGCRESVVLMQEQERALFEKRNKDSKSSTVSLTLEGFALACFSILIVVVLFAVLIRDAIFRRSTQEQLTGSNDQLATTIQILEEQASEMRLLGDARDELQMCLSAREAHDIAAHFVAQLLPGSSGALCMIDNSRQMMESQASWGGCTDVLETFPLDGCCAMRTGHIRWRTPESSVLHCAHFSGNPPSRYICLPLIAHGETLGILYVESSTDFATRTIERHLNPLNALLQLTSMTVAGLNLRFKLENQSIRDSLTGLFNRHFMEITLEREIRRASRRQTSLAIFMIDADNFKQFNDTFGHKAGDQVLRAVADCFLSSVRAEDVVCRYGGEEFVIILPDISPEKAGERAENVRKAISALRVTEHGQTLGAVTVSIGIAMFPGNGRAIEELMQASDRSLYAAKHSGRDRVVFAADSANLPIPAK